MASRKKSGSVGLTPVSPRHWFFRVSLVMLMTAGGSLVIMSKNDNALAVRLRTSIMDIAAPVLAVAASPMNAVSDVGAWFGEMAQLRAQNVALTNENRQLLQWQAAAKAMESENASLRQLLSVAPSQKTSYITARIVSDLGGPYVHSALIGAGTQNGVAKDQAVMNERGLVGRIVEAGNTSSRALLLADMNSRVPVMIESSHEKGILAGASTGLPTLTYLPAGSKVAPGDRIVTSGDGGVFPQNIPVGVVESVEKNAVTIQLFADPSRAEHVTIVDYTL